MNIQNWLLSQRAVDLGLRVAQILPPSIGYTVGRWIADSISRKTQLGIIQAVRANQWVVHDRQADGRELDRFAREAFRHAAATIYDFFHYMDSPAALSAKIEYSEGFQICLQRSRLEGEGTILGLTHLSSFDLLGLALAQCGMQLKALTVPEASGSYVLTNRLRRKYGVEAYPATPEYLRKAARALQAGGTIVTGIDRPLPEAHYRPRFFGLPAALPILHVRMALKHHVPIFTIGGFRQPDGRYCLLVSEPIEMIHYENSPQEILANAERVLLASEAFIRRSPTQWNMTYPVWPEVMDNVPK